MKDNDFFGTKYKLKLHRNWDILKSNIMRAMDMKLGYLGQVPNLPLAIHIQLIPNWHAKKITIIFKNLSTIFQDF